MDTLLQVAASWIVPALFFWFLFSLIAMILIEVLQRFNRSRQRGLQEIITDLMGDELREDFEAHTLVNPLENAQASYISDVLFAKVIIDWLLKNPSAKITNRKPDKDSVYKTMQSNIERLAEKNSLFGKVLQALVVQANLRTEKLPEFLDAVQKDLQTWFEYATNQMTPVYGARLQRLTILVSLLVAFVTNFDVINITVRLWETSKYAELLSLTEKTGQTFKIDIDSIKRLPVGWYIQDFPHTGAELLLKIVGLCLGAFFIALGAQYVFNLFRRQYRPAE
jgi:hypothetical protein